MLGDFDRGVGGGGQVGVGEVDRRRQLDVEVVGRIEPRIEDGAVSVLDVWWERGFAPRRVDGVVDAMREALGAYVRFAQARRLDWPSHLRVEKRLFAA